MRNLASSSVLPMSQALQLFTEDLPNTETVSSKHEAKNSSKNKLQKHGEKKND